MRYLVILVLFSLPLWAERYALLTGIGQYQQGAGISSIDGPPHDVDSIKQVLIQRAGYNPDRIKVLLNGDATKAAILGELDRLARTVQAGDYVVFFYSGHGTSNAITAAQAIGTSRYEPALCASTQ